MARFSSFLRVIQVQVEISTGIRYLLPVMAHKMLYILELVNNAAAHLTYHFMTLHRHM
jgi:hypothetical protein